MGRKNAQEALQDFLRADYDRWTLLVRNEEFRKDVAKYLTDYEKLKLWVNRHEPLWSSKSLRKLDFLHFRYLGKWRVHRLPDLAFWPDTERLITIKGLERWYQAARKGKSDFSVSAAPVRILGSRPGGGFKTIIEISVDHSLTLDQLIPLIHQELRHSYFGGHDRKKPPSLKFQLKVFDLMTKGTGEKQATFKDVAEELGKRPSTIRDAYLSVRRKIATLDIQNEFLDGLERPILKNPKLRHLLDPENLPEAVEDISNCTDCAETYTTSGELCAKHKPLLRKEKSAWRERTGLDLSTIEHARTRRVLRMEDFGSDPSSDD